MKNIKRLWHHFWVSRSFMIGLEHFIVMFPSILLVSKLSAVDGSPLLTISTIFLTCGIGTLILIFGIPKGRKSQMPLLLGPSFAYIGLTSYLIQGLSGSGDPRSYVVWGYFFSAIIQKPLINRCFSYS